MFGEEISLSAIDSVRQLSFAVIGVLLLTIVICLPSCGCFLVNDRLPISSGTQSGNESNTPLKFDLGIVDRERGGYFCMPLSRLPLDWSDEIVSINTSCQCTIAKVVEYLRTDGAIKKALIIEIASSSVDIDGQSLFTTATLNPHVNRAARLAVEVDVVSVSGKTFRITTEFVQSAIRKS